MVLTTAAERDEQVITALIIVLLVIAGLLALLTIWYWRYTNPRRFTRYEEDEFEPDPEPRYDRDARGYTYPDDQLRWAEEPDPYHDTRDRHLT